MFKLFGFGVVLGLAMTGAAAYFLPVNDLHREASIVSVLPNGGNAETFRIHVPDDRVLSGAADKERVQPADLAWPGILAGTELEIFKLRNRDDVVIGVASRLSAPGVLEWVLHLPARGSMYFPLAEAADADGARTGNLRSGTREFVSRIGSLRERYVAGDDGGTIELQAVLIASEVPAGGSAP